MLLFVAQQSSLFFNRFVYQIINSGMKRNLPITVTLRKIQSQANIKISLIVKSTLKVVRVSNPRTIKNGVAKFFGETISLPNAIGSFEFFVLDGQNDQCLAKLLVPRQIVRQFTTRKNGFCTEASGFKIFWQAEYSNENQDKHMESTDRDLNDLEDTPQKGKNIIQPAEKVRRRRQQQGLADTISEPGDFQRINNPSFSSVTKTRGHKQTMNEKDLMDEKIKKSLFAIDEREITSKKSTSKSKSKQKPTTNSNSRKSFRKNNQLRKIMSENQLSVVTKNQNIQPIVVQKKLQRHRSGFLDKFGIKSAVCTGLIGAIAGLSAAQF